jgi:ketosteroid isomerase-like protein
MNAIREVVARLNAAWPAGRTDELVDVLDPDVVVVPPLPAPRVVGRDAVIRSYRDFLSQAVLHRFHPEEPDIDVFGSTAVACCSYTIDYEMEGRRWVGSGREVLVLHEGAAGWKVVGRTVLAGDEKEIT